MSQSKSGCPKKSYRIATLLWPFYVDLVAASEHVAQPVRLVDDVVDAHVALAAVVVQRHASGAVHYVLLISVPRRRNIAVQGDPSGCIVSRFC